MQIWPPLYFVQQRQHKVLSTSNACPFWALYNWPRFYSFKKEQMNNHTTEYYTLYIPTDISQLFKWNLGTSVVLFAASCDVRVAVTKSRTVHGKSFDYQWFKVNISEALVSTKHHSHAQNDIWVVPTASSPALLLLSNWSVAGMSDEPVFGLTTETGC